MRTLEEIHTEFAETGTTVIDKLLEIEQRSSTEYVLRCVTDDSTKFLFTREADLTESRVREYMNAVDIVHEWHEHGYTDVGNWQVDVNFGRPRWYTPEENGIYVRDRPRDKLTINRYGEHIAREFTGVFASRLPVEVSVSIFFQEMSAREFDYLYEKCRSMYKTLTDIHGIGETVALELINGWGCETFEEAQTKVRQTGIPKNYLTDVQNTLSELADDDSEQLLDPEIQEEFSDVVVAQNI